MIVHSLAPLFAALTGVVVATGAVLAVVVLLCARPWPATGATVADSWRVGWICGTPSAGWA